MTFNLYLRTVNDKGKQRESDEPPENYLLPLDMTLGLCPPELFRTFQPNGQTASQRQTVGKHPVSGHQLTFTD